MHFRDDPSIIAVTRLLMGVLLLCLWCRIFLVKVWGDLSAQLTGLFSGFTEFTFVGQYFTGLA